MAYSRDQAQQRADDIAAFQRELAQLEQAQVLSLDEQSQQQIAAYHQQVLSRYSKQFDIDADVQGKRLSLGIRLISTIAAFALVLSLLGFFSEFWDDLSSSVQISLLLGCSIGSLAITWLLKSRAVNAYFTQLAGCLALASFILNLYLFGDLFSLPANNLSLLAWALYGFLLAYACPSRLLLLGAQILLMAFVGTQLNQWADLPWLDLTQRPENLLLPALALLCLPQWIDQQRYSGFAACYRLVGSLSLLGCLLVLSFWGQGSYLNIDPDWLEGAYKVLGFISASVLIWLGSRRDWPEVAICAQLMFVLMLLANAVDWWWDLLPHSLFFLLIGLLAVASLLALTRIRRQLGQQQ